MLLSTTKEDFCIQKPGVLCNGIIRHCFSVERPKLFDLIFDLPCLADLHAVILLPASLCIVKQPLRLPGCRGSRHDA